MPDHPPPLALATWPPRGRHTRLKPNGVQAGLHLTAKGDRRRPRARSTRSLGGPGFIVELGRFMLAATWGNWTA